MGGNSPNSRMSEYFGPLMRSSRAREQRANERFLPLSRERSFRWFHEALVFETSLRPLPPLMFVGFSHRFLPFASNAGTFEAYRCQAFDAVAAVRQPSLAQNRGNFCNLSDAPRWRTARASIPGEIMVLGASCVSPRPQLKREQSPKPEFGWIPANLCDLSKG